jgi:cobalt/nickel transport system permease protein
MNLPDWMIEEPFINEETTFAKKGRRSNFLTKTIRNMRTVICEDLQTEQYAKQDGLLQQAHPGFKLIALIVLILGANLSRQIPVLLTLWLFTILLMRLSRLPVFVMQKRIWGFIPLVTLIFTLPVTLNIFMDGSPLFIIYQSAFPSHYLGVNWPDTLFVTRQGVAAATFLFLRVGISLSLGVMLVMTTPLTEILKSLRILKVPSLFVMIIEMTYRYLLLLLAISIEMFEARNLRTVGNMPGKWQRAQVGSSIASLFARSMALSEEVYQAMCARCYTGEIFAPLPEECPQLELITQI